VKTHDSDVSKEIVKEWEKNLKESCFFWVLSDVKDSIARLYTE
jgi:hypothetical protein